MIEIEKTETYGWEAAIRGMRNPLNSWAKSDSERKYYGGDSYKGIFEIGDNDLNLMKRLRNAGTDHRKYMRMITVYCDITAPLYWWKEFDTYKVGTVANSCSTMHKIQDKEFTLDDFSHEHLINYFQDTDVLEYTNVDGTYNFDDAPVITITDLNDTNLYSPMGILGLQIVMLNRCRNLYLETKDKKYWWQMIQLLPTSYNQKRTVMLNYEVLSNIYKSRKGHRLDEWKTMLDWIETLPYSELITGKDE